MDTIVEKGTPNELLRSVLAQCSKWVEGEQQFKYNGKEYDPMHGLDLYDYGARHYDATIGQFTTMDPLCEKYYHINQIYEEGEQNPERTHKKFLLVRQEGNRSVRRQMSHYFSLRAKW